MDSPVEIPFKSFILLKPDNATPIYLQIVFEFIKAIQTGLLPEGTRLPGTRVLCKLLSVNRNTLIKAFDDLQAQGFIEILPGKGTFILSDQKQKSRPRTKTPASSSAPGNFFFKRSSLLDSTDEISPLPCQFNDGLPDLRLMHTDVLARLYVSKLKNRRNTFSRQMAQSKIHQDLKLQLCNFLNLTRGLRTTEPNLLTASNHEAGLYLACKVIISPGDKVVVASPSYYKANMTLADCGADIFSVGMEDDGLNTGQLRQLCRAGKIRMLYITSNYHYPTTIALSAKKRIEILELARDHDFVVLEDDHDFDFHHDNNPALPLASMDTTGRVVYLSSFARSFPAGFSYGLVTGPAGFITELEKHQNILEPGHDLVKEQVLTDWIRDGEVYRLSKKNKKIYLERRNLFIKLLERHLAGKISYRVPARGLAVWVEWLDKFNLVRLQKHCAALGLFLPKTILYQSRHLTATRLGFGHLDEKEMESAVKTLSLALNKALNSGTEPDR